MRLTTTGRSGLRVTQEEVGRIAGVSGKTVARVIADAPHVSPAIRERVEAAIRQTGFQPNFAARSLAAAKSYLIAIFVPNYLSHYHADLFRGAALACSSRGYHLLLEQYDAGCETSPLERYVSSLSRTRCDGIILAPPLSNDSALIERLLADKVRHVRIAPTELEGASPAVVAEEEVGVIALMDHLWSLGHRKFGLFAPPVGRAYPHRRNEAFIKRFLEKGGQAGDVRIADFSWHGSGVLSGRVAARALLTSGDRPDAIFAFNDEFAHGAMTYAQEIGLPIPQALSVAGFDDGAAAQFAWPPLTTVRQPLELMAENAVDLLTEGGETRICPVELVIRLSTGPKGG